MNFFTKDTTEKRQSSTSSHRQQQEHHQQSQQGSTLTFSLQNLNGTNAATKSTTTPNGHRLEKAKTFFANGIQNHPNQ